MEKYNIIVTDSSANLTIRNWLNYFLVSKRLQYQLRKNRTILVNDVYVPFNSIVKKNDKISITYLQDRNNQNYINVSGFDESLIFKETTDWIVINKPSGIKTHPNSPTDDSSLLNFVNGYLSSKNERAYILSRLDMDTSGLIMFSKKEFLVPIFNSQIAKGIFKKKYIADVSGSFPLSNGLIALPIAKDPLTVRSQKISTVDGVQCLTKFNRLFKSETSSRLELITVTGRTHQLRVHLASLGFPIVNDDIYSELADQQLGQLHLACVELSFLQPFSTERITLKLIPNFK